MNYITAVLEKREQKVFQCGYDYCKIDYLGHLSEPVAMKGAVQEYSKVNFIFSHLGNPVFDQLRRLMQSNKNIYTDISGQYLSGTCEDTPEYRQELKTELQEFLEIDTAIDRIMFGTDFPIQSYQDSIDLIKALGLSQADEEKIFWRNAKKILNI